MSSKIDIILLQNRVSLLEDENKELKKHIAVLAMENSHSKRVFTNGFKSRWRFYNDVKDELKKKFPNLSWYDLKKTSDKLFFSIHNR